MSLEDRIRDIQSRLGNGLYSSEYAIYQGIVTPLISEIGWPIHDTQLVFPQYPVKGKRVDYALCVQKNKLYEPYIFIEVKQPEEVKQPSDFLDAKDQLFGYVRDKQIPFAILTDGKEWHFYLLTEEGSYDELYMLDLIERDVSESSSYLQRYLSFDKVSSGEALENAQQDYKNVLKERKAKESISEAWKKLIEGKDEKLIEVVSEKVKGIFEFKPDQQQVISYLKLLKEKSGLSPVTVTSNRSSPTEENHSTIKQGSKIKVTFPDGSEIYDHTVKNTFVKTIKAIGVKKVEALKIEANSHPLVSKTQTQGRKKERRFSWVDVGSGFYVNTRPGTKQKLNILNQINKKLELGLEIELLPPE